MRVVLDGDAEGTRQPKVSQFERPFLGYQQILWLEVSVQHPQAVAVGHASHQLLQLGFHCAGVQPEKFTTRLFLLDV